MQNRIRNIAAVATVICLPILLISTNFDIFQSLITMAVILVSIIFIESIKSHDKFYNDMSFFIYPVLIVQLIIANLMMTHSYRFMALLLIPATLANCVVGYIYARTNKRMDCGNLHNKVYTGIIAVIYYILLVSGTLVSLYISIPCLYIAHILIGVWYKSKYSMRLAS